LETERYRDTSVTTKFDVVPIVMGQAMAQLVEALRYKLEIAGSFPSGVTGNFHGFIPPSAVWPWGQRKLLQK
jgi:hypothetical protein